MAATPTPNLSSERACRITVEPSKCHERWDVASTIQLLSLVGSHGFQWQYIGREMGLSSACVRNRFTRLAKSNDAKSRKRCTTCGQRARGHICGVPFGKQILQDAMSGLGAVPIEKCALKEFGCVDDRGIAKLDFSEFLGDSGAVPSDTSDCEP